MASKKVKTIKRAVKTAAKRKAAKPTRRNPATQETGEFVIGDDGKQYPKRIASGAISIALTADVGPASVELATRVEQAAADAIRSALDAGVDMEQPERQKAEFIIPAINAARSAG